MPAPPVEIAWFCPLCDDDYRHLGVPDPALRSSFPHCRDVLLGAERAGFDNILCPSGYGLGIDSVTFAGGVAPLTSRIRLLVAVRCGEMWPPQLARQLATLDRMLGGRLTINIISSDLPGAPVESAPRYRRTRECMRILRALLDGKPVAHHGEFYDLELEPPAVRPVAGRCPPLYFGGLSDDARETAAEEADVFLMWPEPMADVRALLDDMRARAARHGRRLRFGYRVHVVVRETESAARAAARELVSQLDAATGEAIRRRSLDHASIGVRRQAEMRVAADDEGYVEENLWTGIGRARSGCGAAIVGDPDQVVAKLRAYAELGIEAFILSGYPHAEECALVGRHVLPRIAHGALAPGLSGGGDVIETARLRLHALDAEFLRASLAGEHERAETLLGMALPADWPNATDVHVLRMRLAQLDADPICGPWLTRGIELVRERRLIGIGGFHGPPGGAWLAEVAPGGVELGYTIYPPWRRQGFAFEACRALIAWAAARGVRAFVLSIDARNRASVGLARKLGFEKVATWRHEVRGLEDVYRLETSRGGELR